MRNIEVWPEGEGGTLCQGGGEVTSLQHGTHTTPCQAHQAVGEVGEAGRSDGLLPLRAAHGGVVASRHEDQLGGELVRQGKDDLVPGVQVVPVSVTSRQDNANIF